MIMKCYSSKIIYLGYAIFIPMSASMTYKWDIISVYPYILCINYYILGNVLCFRSRITDEEIVGFCGMSDKEFSEPFEDDNDRVMCRQLTMKNQILKMFA